MQGVFAFEANSKEDINLGEKKLTASIEGCYTLFLYFFSIFPELKRYRLNKLEDLKDKMFPTYEDLNPNTKFVENLVISQIEDNISLNQLWNQHQIRWDDQGDFIAQIFQEISRSEPFQLYMNNTERSYTIDKKLVLDIVETVFAQSELLHWFLEEKNVHWFDDYNEALLMVYKNISTFSQIKENNNKITSLYKDPKEDVDFYKTLFRKVVLYDKFYAELIKDKLQNWEMERIMGTDMILMKMAICEFTEFPEIPIKVTINEYIELAKQYSSRKSGLFINGLLDKIVYDLKEDGKLTKMGRGLIN
ncbi:MAG TPA: transcription antitermination factor NusB [Bacteroidales bacterium]|nr:transcription antitermination factor NusB [Bacteroidales bacterium]